jgi:hypothetical protein
LPNPVSGDISAFGEGSGILRSSVARSGHHGLQKGLAFARDWSEGNSAVITWNTGWTTKVTKEGDRYIKTAYGKGQSLTATPTNTGRRKG